MDDGRADGGAGESICLLPPGEVKVRLVVASDAVVGDLELLRGLHVEASHLVSPGVHMTNILMLLLFQPGCLGNSIQQKSKIHGITLKRV